MKATNDNPLAMRAVNFPKENLLETFKTNNRLLDEIQKSLEAYLEKKRIDFQRFFFLSNDELLLILAEANRNPDTVQPHLRKCFENI
jgi:dynein heavy chain